MESEPSLEERQPKARNEYKAPAKSVSEYAYTEDGNYYYRDAMEDDHFIRDNIFGDGRSAGLFGILDGHGGYKVSRFCTDSIPDNFCKLYDDYDEDLERLFQVVFNKIDDELKIIGAAEVGSTACVCFVRKETSGTVAYIANLGDTRAILVSLDGVERITVDHKASDPKEVIRIEEVQGIVMNNRVSGQLAVTRALGDLNLKREGVINTPYFRKVNITPKDKFIIIASDGLWDVIDDQKTYELVKGIKSSEEISKTLVNYALKNATRDNVSVLVLKFN